VDVAKNVIQVHAVDRAGRRLVSRPIKREQLLAWCAQLPAGCLVAIEACSRAHHWARHLRVMGLDARLIAANFVSPYRMEGRSARRYDRRGGDLRGCLTPNDALRAEQELRAAGGDESAPRA
jgi:transposase